MKAKPTPADIANSLGELGQKYEQYLHDLLIAANVAEDRRQLLSDAFIKGIRITVDGAKACLVNAPEPPDERWINDAIDWYREQNYGKAFLEGYHRFCRELKLTESDELYAQFFRFYRYSVGWIKPLLVEAMLALHP